MRVQRRAVSAYGGRLTPYLGVLDHQAVGEVLHRWRGTGGLPLLAQIDPASNAGEKVLHELACLVDGNLAVGAKR